MQSVLTQALGNLCRRKLLMVTFLSRDDKIMCSQREVNAGIGHQAGLKFCQIIIQGLIRSEGSNDGRQNLANKVDKVSIGWVFNIKTTKTDVIHELIVYNEAQSEFSKVV